jgi:hypothetical protein
MSRFRFASRARHIVVRPSLIRNIVAIGRHRTDDGGGVRAPPLWAFE